MNIGRRIYYDKPTGNVLVDTGERSGHVCETTVDQDIAAYTALLERVRDTFDVIELPYGQHAQDFRECIGYRVNPQTAELEFAYPDPDNPEELPTFEPPLTAQIIELRGDNAGLKQRLEAAEDAILALLFPPM